MPDSRDSDDNVAGPQLVIALPAQDSKRTCGDVDYGNTYEIRMGEPMEARDAISVSPK